jgi:uncharacterized membrane protein
MTPLHIVSGLIALLAGAIALAAKKGGPLHRNAGLVFVVSMAMMAASGALLAALKPDALSVVAGLLSLYLVATAVLTVRDVGARAQALGWTAAVLAFVVGIAGLALGLQTALSATGKLHGYSPAPYFVFATVALLGAGLDVRMLLGVVPVGRQRVARHLWRMCCAKFIATSSFFLGQAKVFPEPMRNSALLSLPVLAVLLLWAYWLKRVLQGRPGDA